MPNRSDSSSRWPYRPTVYYDRGGTIVTDVYVHTTHGRFPIAELGDLRCSIPYPHPGRIVALIVAGLEGLAAVPFAIVYRSTGVLLVGLLVALSVAGGVMRDARRRPQWYAIEGIFRGINVKIFSTRDETEFQRVRLALVRARDAWHAASY